ncbi:ESPR-type extended signal peptide-containing protein, partial [Bisgaard Taxon 10/6]|uniref:ESPR-type extended signal peptide-containing protein n=2 Tax=Exercitatus varius TaxID=67857 RepID=UPI00294B764F
MNHIYKVIWNKTTQSLVVVSELAASRSKTKSSKRRAKKITQETIELFTKTVGTLTLGSAVLSSAPVVLAVGAAAIFKPSQAEAYVNNASYATASNYSVAIGANTSANYRASAMGGESVAIGGRANSSGFQTLAIGTNTTASGDQSITIGSDVKATGYSSIAIGSDDLDQIAGQTIAGYYVPSGYTATHAAAAGAIVLGARSVASGRLSTILGSLSTASADGATVLGSGSNASGQSSTIVGFNSTASAANATVVGSFSVANASNAIAIGTNSTANGTGALAFGQNAISSGVNSVAMGATANATADGAIAIGDDSRATNKDALAQGKNTRASGNGSTAVGNSAKALANSSTALGNNANASQQFSTALGTGSKASESATAVGNDANASGFASFAAALNATASGYAANAIGFNSVSSGMASLAAGYNATTNGTNALAIGSSAQALANNAISIGTGNIVSGENSGAIGDPTYVTGYGTYSIGNNNGWVTGNNSGVFGNNNSLTSDETRVIGNNNTIAADNTVAMGNNITVLNSGAINSIVIGESAHTESANATAIGVSSNASAESSVSIGTNSNAVTENTTAIGNKAYAQGYNSTAIGMNASTWENNGVAIGSYANATGVSAISVGTNSIATETGSAAYGMNANASNVNALAIGTGTQAKSRDSVAIGNQSVSAEVRGVAIGTNANVASAADDGIAIGTNAVANGKQAIAAGLNASATANNTVAIGSAAKASGDSSFSGGVNSNASGDSSTAVGVNAQATKSAAVALGSEAKALSDSTIAIGNRANANAQSAVAVGENSNATGNFSTALGDTTTASGLRSVAVGIDANATATNAVAVGDSAFAGSQGALALGFGAQANSAHSVALGEGSIATAGVDTDSATVNGLTYGGFAGSHVNSTLSVGHDNQYRQIQKVAAGQVTATSTDAINGSQLYATQGVIGNVAKSVVDNFGGNAAVDGNGTVTFTNIGGTGEDNINDAIAAAKTEVKGGTNIAGVTETKGANNQTVYTVNANGTTISNGSGAVTINATSAGNNITNYAVDLSQKTKNDIQQGVDANTTVNSKGITFAADSGTATERKLGETLTVNGDGDLINTTASAGKLEVAATDKLKDAVTNATSALQSVVTQIDGKDVKTLNKADNKANFVSGDNISLTNDGQGGIKVATKDNVTFTTVNATTFNAGDVSISSNGINAGGKTVTNVANGTKDSDAVNLSQLNATNANVANNAQNITNNANNISNNTKAIANNTQNITTNANNIAANTAAIKQGFNIGADNGNDDNVQLGETVNYNGDSNIITTVSNNAIAFALNSSIAVDNVTVNDTFKAGDVTINNNGIDAGNHAITNVTAGTNATDAVNVAQLNASQSSVKAGDNVNVISAKDANGTVYTVNANTSTVSNGSDKVTVTKTNAGNHTSNYAVDLSDAAKSSLTKADSALQSLTTSADGNQAQTLNQENSNANFISGNNIQLTPSANGITVATKADVTFTNVTATNVNGNTVTIGSGANTTTLTSTAEGLDVGGDKLTNISAGTNKTDAVNLGQLEKYIGDNSYNWNLSDGTTSNAVADNSTVAIKGSANADSAKTAGIVTALDGTNVSVDLSEQTKSDIQQGVNANTTVNKGFNIGADNGNDDNVQLGETVNYNGDSNIITTVTDNAIAFALNSSIAVDNVTVNNTFKAGDVTINNSGIDAGNHTITNVTAGTNATDAVNLGQLNASKSQVKSGDNTEVTSTSDANGTVYTVNANTSTVSNGSDKVTVTKTDAGNHTRNYAVDLSQSAKDSLTKADSALQSWTAQVNGAEAKVVNQTSNTVNFVNGTNTVVSADANGNISVSTAENVTFNTVNASTFNAGDVTINNNGINAGNHTITNVANGTKDSDAVNFSQLNATNANVTNNAQNITNNTNAINKGINFGNGTSANNFALGSTINVKPSDSNLVVKTVADGVELALADSIAVSNVTVNDTFKAGDVTINSAGIDAGNHAITNVTAGTNATDAVNLGQLEKYIGDNSYNWNLSDGTTSNAVADNSTVAIKGSANADSAKTAGIVTALDGTNVSVDLSEQTKSDIQQGVDANTTVNNKGITFGADSGTATERKLGETLTVNGDGDLINTTASAGKIEVAATDKLKNAVTNATSALQSVVTQIDGKDVKTLNKADNKANFVSGDNISLTDDGQGGIKIATKENVTFNTVNASTFNAGDVSISSNGINAGGKTVTNVANGTQDSDAVNLSQLNATNTNVANNAQNITNNANNITNNTNAINKGINFGNGTKANNFALGSTINVTSDSNLVVSTVTDGVKLTLADSIAVGNVTVNDTFKAGDVTINSAGIDAGNHAITNVTAGTNATDAVNVAQLEANTTRYYSVNSTATGNRKNDGATGANAMAAGANATASGDNATAIGQGTKANSAAAIAIGNNANATSSSNDSVIAIGNNAQSTGSYSIAVGTNSVASNTWSMAMGISAKATGDYATGLGSNAQATAQWTTALGAGANATESAATAVGSNATAGADGATVIGYNSSVTGANTTALGNNINVSTEGSVVLGNNSAAATATTETAATVNNLTYSDFAGAGNVAAGDYVSVGSAGQERQIKYVAPGNISATSTDAINGSQLYATNRVLGNVANSVVNNFGGNAAVDSNGNVTFTDIGGTGETTIHDAIKNVSDVANTGWNVQTNGDTATKVAPGDTVQFKDGKNIKITRTDKDITVATADDVSFNSINTSTLTAGPVTINSNGIDAGSQKITNVATGTNGTDAVNLDQLNQTISASAYNWNISDGTNTADVPDNGTVAVKGSANADSANISGIVTTLDGTNVSVDLSDKAKDSLGKADTAIQTLTTSADGKLAQTLNKDDNNANFTSGKNIVLTPSATGIAIATADNVTFTTVNATTFNAGDVVVSEDGINAGNKTITNVAAGQNGT